MNAKRTLSLIFVFVLLPLAGWSEGTAGEQPLRPESFASQGMEESWPDVVADAGQNVELVSRIGGRGYAVAVQGNYAYLGEGSDLVILDISDPAHPTATGKVSAFPEAVSGVAVAGNYAYVANGEAGLRIINVSDALLARVGSPHPLTH